MTLDKLFERPEWKDAERQAAEAGKAWAEQFRKVSPELRQAIDREASIKHLHKGNKP